MKHKSSIAVLSFMALIGGIFMMFTTNDSFSAQRLLGGVFFCIGAFSIIGLSTTEEIRHATTRKYRKKR